MRYPNSNKHFQKETIKNTAHRGMSLESEINQSNQYYLDNDLANIHKKPTPITIVNVDYPRRSAAKITEAYFKVPSTTDYNGVYKGRYIDFEAKECHSKSAFPFTSIHPHQIKHLKSVLEHGAIAFLIMRMACYDQDYLIRADEFLAFYFKGERKSLPYSWIKEHGYPIAFKLMIPCDYLKAIDQAFKL